MRPMAHLRHSRPFFGRCFQLKMFDSFKVFAFRSEADLEGEARENGEDGEARGERNVGVV